jgi:hypothetical protein
MEWYKMVGRHIGFGGEAILYEDYPVYGRRLIEPGNSEVTGDHSTAAFVKCMLTRFSNTHWLLNEKTISSIRRNVLFM